MQYRPGVSMPPPPQPPYAWGMPPLPLPLPPPTKSRVALVIGIAGAVFVVVLAILLTLVVIGVKAESGFPEAHFALVLPRTLLDGRYELTKDLSSTAGRKIEKESAGVRDAKITHGVVGQYSLGGDPAKGALVITGFYGRFKHNARTRAEALKGDGEADGATVSVPPRDVTRRGRPSGSAARCSRESGPP